MRRFIGPASILRTAACAVLLPAAATLIALPSGNDAIAAVLYLLAVVLAATVGGTRGGLAAAVLSFLSFNYFFTPPRRTFLVGSSEDVIALGVFLAVSTIVGVLVARAWEDRERALRRERETLLVATLANGLLSPLSLEQVLGEFAHEIVALFGLAGCRLRVDGYDGEIEVRVWPEESLVAEHPELELVLASPTRRYGSMLVARGAGQPPFEAADRRLYESLAKQLILGLEQERLNREIGDARLEADTSRTRAALFSSVTHDLRTPLASIKAAVTSLLQEEVEYRPDQQRDLLQTVLEETDRLNRLVGNLLGLARVRAGALVPAKELTPMEEIVESVLVRMRTVLGHHSVRTIFRPEVKPVLVDPLQMDQVLSNILENAIRHSPQGSEILVSVSMWQSSLQVRVADQGPGIPAEERERVFETFHKSPAGGGTGLGLAIAAAIVNAHGGRIWAEGAPGGGAAIVMELPVEPDERKEE
ncbi:MAG: ATP-binding protein [Actinomycetota bacterium]